MALGQGQGTRRERGSSGSARNGPAKADEQASADGSRGQPQRQIPAPTAMPTRRLGKSGRSVEVAQRRTKVLQTQKSALCPFESCSASRRKSGSAVTTPSIMSRHISSYACRASREGRCGRIPACNSPNNRVKNLAFSLQDLENREDSEASSTKTLPSHECEHRPATASWN